MRINWLVRFRNKTFLASFLALVIAFVYNLLALFGVTPTVQQDALWTAVNAILTVLGMIGVIADPTTKGISDSAQTLTADKSGNELHNLDLDLAGCKKFIKITVTVNCAGGTSP